MAALKLTPMQRRMLDAVPTDGSEIDRDALLCACGLRLHEAVMVLGELVSAGLVVASSEGSGALLRRFYRRAASGEITPIHVEYDEDEKTARTRRRVRGDFLPH